MSNVTILPVVTRFDIPVERVLNDTADADLDCCVVVGFYKDGGLFFSSSYADGGDVLWLFEKAKKALMEIE